MIFWRALSAGDVPTAFDTAAIDACIRILPDRVMTVREAGEYFRDLIHSADGEKVGTIRWFGGYGGFVAGELTAAVEPAEHSDAGRPTRASPELWLTYSNGGRVVAMSEVVTASERMQKSP